MRQFYIKNLPAPPTLFSKSGYKVQTYTEKGIVERVHVDLESVERSTTKVRIVYSARPSLSVNACLQKLSNLIPKLFDVCSYPIIVTADIEKAF